MTTTTTVPIAAPPNVKSPLPVVSDVGGPIPVGGAVMKEGGFVGIVGSFVGASVGFGVGSFVGFKVGAEVGEFVGFGVGSFVGFSVGNEVGVLVG
jgi:hypothetical protein